MSESVINEEPAVRKALVEGLKAKGITEEVATARANAVLSTVLTDARGRVRSKVAVVAELMHSPARTPEVMRAKMDPRMGLGNAWVETLQELRTEAETLAPAL